MSKPTCCLNCHLDYEEEIALPYLPRKDQQKILLAHALLRARGLPRRAVEKHSKREEKLYRLYCPSSVCEKIEQDHKDYENGLITNED